MFRSESLVRITIQVPEQFISAATTTLTGFRLLHLIRIDETQLGHLGYGAETDVQLLNKYENLFKELEGLLESLQIRPEAVTLNETVLPEKEIYKARDRLSKIRQTVESVLGNMGVADAGLRNRRALLDRFRFLPGDLDLSKLSERRFVNWTIGLTPSQGLEKLEESLAQVHHALIDIGTLENRSLIFVFGLKKDWSIFEEALKGAFFDAMEIPSEFSGTVAEIVAKLQSEVSKLEEQEKNLIGQRETLQSRFGRDLLILREKIIAARQILSARRLFGKIDKSYVISDWIPERVFSELGEELEKVTEGQVVLEKVDPGNLREVRGGIIRIPILFNNPLLISPFERLTDLYGTPCYKEVEPTVFFAVSFLLMFGMMFGDIGQGGVLFLVGYLVFRRFYGSSDYGVILMECGLSSALFGLLYGSVFGLEDVIPALWFKPMENIFYFVRVTLIFGAVLLSLGFLLNLINALRLKEYERLLGGSGATGALFYWMSAGLALKYLMTGRIARVELRLLGWSAAVLIVLMVLHRPIYRLVFKRERLRQVVGEAGFFSELVESIVEVFDDLIRFIANTVSFIRIAAFALSHAALFVAVFSVADVLSHKREGGLIYWLVVVLGNIVIILLEGLVVSIQTVRLEYYEFFGKFFRGGGERFKPFGREIGSKAKEGTDAQS